MVKEFWFISSLAAKSILNADNHLVREFGITYTSYLLFSTFCNKGLTGNLLFKSLKCTGFLQPLLLAASIEGVEGISTFQSIYITPVQLLPKGILLWTTLKLTKVNYVTGYIRTRRQTNEPTNKMHNKQMKGERE